MTVNRIIAAILLGTASLLTAFTFAVASNNMAFTAILSGLACIGTSIAALKAPSGRQAWGRGFLGLAATLIVMPFLLASALGQQFDNHTAQSLMEDDAALSAAIVSSMLVGVSTLFGVFFGAIALVIGLILNRAPTPPWQPPQDMPRG
jgi:vacuolar-type H+-ATPase subunit I/STV1